MNVAGIPKLTGTHHGSIIQWFIYITLQLCEGCKHPLSHNTLVNATIPFNSAPKKCFFFPFPVQVALLSCVSTLKRPSAHWHTPYWYSNSVRMSVHPSVCPLHSGVLSKRLNILFSFFTTRLPSHSNFMSIKHIREILTGSHPAGC